MQKYTICDLVKELKITQFKKLLQKIEENNFNPMSLSKTEVSILIFGEKKIFEFEQLKSCRKNQKESFFFIEKNFIIDKNLKSEKTQKWEKEIEEISNNFFKTREKYFEKKIPKNKKTKDIVKYTKKWLNLGYKVNDFIIVNEYSASLYKNSDFNEKMKEGIYFRPSTIYNEKFTDRLEEAKYEIEKKDSNIKKEVDIKEILLDFFNNRKLFFDFKYTDKDIKNSFDIYKKLIDGFYTKIKSKEILIKLHKHIAEKHLNSNNDKVRKGIYFRIASIYNENIYDKIEELKLEEENNIGENNIEDFIGEIFEKINKEK